MELHPHLRHPAAGRTELLLVRHGRTASNRRRVLQGWSDIPLDELGLLQAQRIALRIRDEYAIDRIVSSPLQRALVTARAIGDQLGLAPEVLPALREMNFGDYEGRTFDEVALNHPDLVHRLADLADDEVAWPGGEMRGAFHLRVREAFRDVLLRSDGQRVAVVAHGGVIGSFLASVRGGSPNDPSIYDLANCGLSHLEVTTDHTVVHLRNCIVHLEGLDDPIGVEEAGA